MRENIFGIKYVFRFYLQLPLQVIIVDREDNLERSAHKLNQIITEYCLTISIQKTKSMAFRGRDPVRTKIVIDNKIMEQVN
jgi:PII-like signaling protein